jgi:hypothetical protein
MEMENILSSKPRIVIFDERRFLDVITVTD